MSIVERDQQESWFHRASQIIERCTGLPVAKDQAKLEKLQNHTGDEPMPPMLVLDVERAAGTMACGDMDGRCDSAVQRDIDELRHRWGPLSSCKAEDVRKREPTHWVVWRLLDAWSAQQPEPKTETGPQTESPW